MSLHLFIRIIETVFFIGVVGSLIVVVFTFFTDIPELFTKH
jgi:hypothetical protein